MTDISRVSVFFILLILTNTQSFAEDAVLFLHGLNSSSDAWDDVVQAEFAGNCVTLRANHIEAVGVSEANARGAYCFRLDFGHFDGRASGLSELGLEGLKCGPSSASGFCHGDFTPLRLLGQEVEFAVGYIATQLPDSEIILVGHSRGGLAARSYLQGLGSEHNVRALLTIGTPHSGSPFGRIWRYLEENCVKMVNGQNIKRTDGGDCSLDWKVADRLRTITWVTSGLRRGEGLDIRVPAIDMLSPESNDILNLNDNVNWMPENMRYVSMIFDGYNLGSLDDVILNIDYDIMGQLSEPAQEAILQWENDEHFLGDGIVPLDSQRMSTITGSPNSWTLPVEEPVYYARHIDQTHQVPYIVANLRKLYSSTIEVGALPPTPPSPPPSPPPLPPILLQPPSEPEPPLATVHLGTFAGTKIYETGVEAGTSYRIRLGNLRADNEGHLTGTYSLVSPAGTAGIYAGYKRGDTIRFMVRPPANASCAHAFSGVLSGEAITGRFSTENNCHGSGRWTVRK